LKYQNEERPSHSERPWSKDRQRSRTPKMNKQSRKSVNTSRNLIEALALEEKDNKTPIISMKPSKEQNNQRLSIIQEVSKEN
jgi:hypothetical protein